MSAPFSDREQANLSESLVAFLKSLNRYQAVTALSWCRHCCGEKNTGEGTIEEGNRQKSIPR